MVDIRFLFIYLLFISKWRQGLSQARKEDWGCWVGGCLVGGLVLGRIRFLEEKEKKKNQHPFSHSSYSLQTHTHTLALLPADHRTTPSSSHTQDDFCGSNKINMDPAICGALWSLDSQNSLMIAGLINTIRQLVPADYLPLISNLTAVPPIKIKAQKKKTEEYTRRLV